MVRDLVIDSFVQYWGAATIHENGPIPILIHNIVKFTLNDSDIWYIMV